MAYATGTATSVQARLWAAPPNWSTSYKITYSFKTEIIKSASGREQRSALRRTPRKNIEYTSTIQGDALRSVKEHLWGRQHLAFVIPEEPRFVRLAASVLAGDLVLQLDSVPAWLTVGGMLVLSDSSKSEMLPVESIDGANITMMAAAGSPWPAGTRVHYGIGGFVESSLNSTRITSRAGEVSVVFNGEPASEVFDGGAGTIFPLFDGAPVFLKKPNWSDTPAITSEHDVTEVDFDRGAVVRFTPIAFGRELRQSTYVGRDFTDAEAIRNLFYRCRGQWKPFWAPTWEFDILPSEAVPSGSSAVTVAGWDFHKAYADSTVHGAIFVKWADGTVAYRRIVAIDKAMLGSGAQVSSITLASAFSRAINPTADMVGWLYLCRFASDQLTIEWLTRTVAQTQVQFTTVEVEPNLADLS